VVASSQFDELNAEVKKLSSQIATICFMLSQTVIPCEAASVRAEPDSAPIGERANCGAFDQKRCRHGQSTSAVKPPLPDPRLIRRIIQQRQRRDRFFNNELFGEPAWDMLLDLAAATMEYRQVSVTSLCIASRVPLTTALRWVSLMTDQGLLRRVEDPQDRRRAFISLTEAGMSALSRYFESLGPDAKVLA
jgi:hypothetical protein